MLGGEDGIDLPPEQNEKTLDIEAVPHRGEGHQIFLRQSKQTNCWIHPSPVFWVGRARILFLQMDKATRSLDQPLK